MKKNLLFLVTLLLSVVTGYAQGDSKETAVDLVIGDNDYVTAETDVKRYYKYTAETDQALVLAVDNQNWKFNIQTYVYRYSDDSSVGYVFFPSPNQHYLLRAGEEVYIKVTGYPYSNLDGAEWNMKVTASVVPGDDIQEFAEHGLSAEDAVQLVDDKMHFVNGGASGATVYFTYTAPFDGKLALKTNLYGNVFCNDVEMEKGSKDGLYLMKADVKANETYKIYANYVYGMACVVPSCYVPEAGSIDKPYDLADVNTVPAAAGKYYYKAVPTERCNVKVSSEETLPGAESWVKLYDNLNNVNSDYARVTTENGSFNINYSMKDFYGDEVYYLVVNKTEATEAAQSFNFAFVPFQPGDIFEKPLDAAAENEVSGVGTDGTGVRYYKYVPETDCRLTVTVVPADAENSDVKVTFPLDSWNVLTAMQDGNAYTVFAESEIPYIVKLEGVKDGDKVLFAENEFQKGDSQYDPIELENGVEVSLGGGIIPERWYSYTNNEGEALNFVVDNLPLYIYGQVAYGIIPEDGDDPLMTDVWSSNGEEFAKYSAIIQIAPGQTCIFKIAFREDCGNGTIKVEESELPEGITYGKPYMIEDGSQFEVSVSNRADGRWFMIHLNEKDKLSIQGTGWAYFDTYVGLENVVADQSNYDDYYTYVGPDYPDEIVALESADFYLMCYYSNENTVLTFNVERDPTSGINEVNANADFNLNGNVLTVAGNAKVYSLDGAMVGEITNNSSLSLNKGVYLINVNGTVKKVMVK